MVKLYLRIREWFKGEQGQDLVEYALLLGLIALLVILAVTFLGEEISEIFSDIAQAISGWDVPASP